MDMQRSVHTRFVEGGTLELRAKLHSQKPLPKMKEENSASRVASPVQLEPKI